MGSQAAQSIMPYVSGGIIVTGVLCVAIAVGLTA